MLPAFAFLADRKPLARSAAIAASMALWLAPGQAGAVTLPGLALGAGCPPTAQFAPAAAPVGVEAIGISKSDAILGGTGSALDRIREQQASLALPSSLRIDAVRKGDQLGLGLSCATASLAMPVMPQMPLATAAPLGDDAFLATERVAIRRTSFTPSWNRVSEAPLPVAQVRTLIHADEESATGQLQAVNRWVNRAIIYTEDRENWSSRDYWATAGETMRRRRGDCEDIAIVKYQMLLSLGLRPEDLYLTLVRDLARNADHAVLVVRSEGRFYLLDNALDAVLPADQTYDYRPTLSFNNQSAWVHGAVVAPASPTYLSVNAISSPRVIGFSR
jgi:predicted transglutaminase-like cysteine proteinase